MKATPTFKEVSTQKDEPDLISFDEWEKDVINSINEKNINNKNVKNINNRIGNL